MTNQERRDAHLAYIARHPLHPDSRNSGYEYGADVVIGSNVWIGGSVVITPGVHIGDCCVIGAGSVVTKDIPAWSLAAGNPCRVIREITEKDRRFYFKAAPHNLARAFGQRFCLIRKL